MGFLRKYKLASLDKRITHLLRDSKWYNESKDKEKLDLTLKDIDRNEYWVKKVEEFIGVVWDGKEYRKLIEQYDLTKEDLIDFFLLMTIATMPNPIFLTGLNRMSNTLVGTAMYQEIDRQLIRCLDSLGYYDNKEEQEKYGHRYASDVMVFALDIRSAHNMAYGEITLEEVF